MAEVIGLLGGRYSEVDKIVEVSFLLKFLKLFSPAAIPNIFIDFNVYN